MGVDPPSFSPDPTAILQWEYAPGRYSKAFVRTNARDRGHLDPVWVVEQAIAALDKDARDHRYTEMARQASSDFADLLRPWLAAKSDSSRQGPEHDGGRASETVPPHTAHGKPELLDLDDLLRDDLAAQEWVRRRPGPFDIRLRITSEEA